VLHLIVLALVAGPPMSAPPPRPVPRHPMLRYTRASAPALERSPAWGKDPVTLSGHRPTFFDPAADRAAQRQGRERALGLKYVPPWPMNMSYSIKLN
jgi:hypothetical protein